jgi:adenine phosphoribosyltransferase
MLAEPARSLDETLRTLVRDVPDFPEPGIIFKDIAPLLGDAQGFAQVVDALAAFGRDDSGRTVIDKVAGVEARGFILAAPVASALGSGFVPIRKAGKLPGPTHRATYALEYGEATLEVQHDAFDHGDRVLVIDDVLATGGTLLATSSLIGSCGGSVDAVAVLIELGFLPGREALAELTVHSLLTVD